MSLPSWRYAQRATRNVKIRNGSAKRCVLRVARGEVFVLLLTLGLCSSLPLHAADPVMKTLSAHVVKVAADGTSLGVDFRHPATGEVQRMTFQLEDPSVQSSVEKLKGFRPGQVVNIDYVEGEEDRLLIRRIARVELSGPPAGLENFRGL